MYVVGRLEDNHHGKLTVGNTLAISWLPVTERARSTIIARRALLAISETLTWPYMHVPFGGFTHTFDDSIQRIFPAFFESLGDRFRPLFVRRELEESIQEMVKCQFAMLFRPMFKNYNALINSSRRQIEVSLTVLNAVRAPLTFGNLTENDRSLIEKLIDNAVFSFSFKILESMLRIPLGNFGVCQKLDALPGRQVSQFRGKRVMPIFP